MSVSCNVQVPGLFEGDEFTTLMTQCKEGSQREGLMLDSSEELYKWFTQQVRQRCTLESHPAGLILGAGCFREELGILEALLLMW